MTLKRRSSWSDRERELRLSALSSGAPHCKRSRSNTRRSPFVFRSRHPEHDFLYRDELEKAEQHGIVQLHTAFSRFEDGPKTYVQDLIKEDAERLIHLLNNGGRLYVCGDGANMAPAVEDALCEAYEHILQASKEEAQSWISKLQEEGRYAKDVWSGAGISGGTASVSARTASLKQKEASGCPDASLLRLGADVMYKCHED